MSEENQAAAERRRIGTGVPGTGSGTVMDELERLGRARQRAFAAYSQATGRLRDAVVKAAASGQWSEVEIARLAGVDRQTVRKWRGKKPWAVDNSTGVV